MSIHVLPEVTDGLRSVALRFISSLSLFLCSYLAAAAPSAIAAVQVCKQRCSLLMCDDLVYCVRSGVDRGAAKKSVWRIVQVHSWDERTAAQECPRSLARCSFAASLQR